MIRFATTTLLSLLTTACYAAGSGRPTASVPAAAASSATAPKAQAKPSWPDNGIAQRRFKGGGVMFVEDDHGKRRAWVLSDYDKPAQIDHDHAWAEALDFFSGKILKVKVDLTDDGHEDRAFTDSSGAYHFYGADPRFRFSGIDMMRSLPGLDFNGHSINVPATVINGCALHLDATAAAEDWVTGQKPATVWQKYPIYHSDPAPKGCRSGDLASAIGTALDLGDGTFLATEGCFVFRLRKSDLAPVGSAPALRVVDENTVHAALAKLHGKTIDDPTGYLIKALNLSASPELSCKAD